MDRRTDGQTEPILLPPPLMRGKEGLTGLGKLAFGMTATNILFLHDAAELPSLGSPDNVL